MHVETYPAFLTRRDEKPSLSSFEEKSSEFGWLERKITRKQKYIYEKQSKCSVKYIPYYYKRFVVLPLKNRLPRAIYKESYKTKYLRLFTPFPNLINKNPIIGGLQGENGDLDIKKSEEKYPKVSVANFGKLQEKFRCIVQNSCEIISQQKGDFAAMQNSSFSLQ